METHPREGVVKEEVSKYQETLSQAGGFGISNPLRFGISEGNITRRKK